MFLGISSYLPGISRGHQVHGIMKDFPSCFGESGVQIADSSSSSSSTIKAAAQNLVTCIYHHKSQAFSGFISVTWIKYMMGQGLSIGIENSDKECLCKVDIKPWLFSRRKGFKTLVVDSTKVEVFWDLSSARFGAGPEPLDGFYLSVALNQEPCLFLGDSQNGLHKRIDRDPFDHSEAVFVAKREHICGKRLYSSKAQFCDKGQSHDLKIEYDPSENFGKCLLIYIDSKAVLQVTQLMWKFRGNQSIVVDGMSIEVYWDVYNWIFGAGVVGNAIFLFQSRSSAGEKPPEQSPARWNAWERSKDLHDSQSNPFSFVVCAWKNE